MNSYEKMYQKAIEGKLDEVTDMLKENIEEEAAKENKKGKQHSIVKKLQKRCVKAKYDRLAGEINVTFHDADNYAYCDGTMILVSPISLLKDSPSLFEGDKIVKMLPRSYDIKYTSEIDRTELVTFIKTAPKSKDIIIKEVIVNNKSIYYDAVKLLEVLDFTETNTLYFADDNRTIPAYAYSDNNGTKALLLPYFKC